MRLSHRNRVSEQWYSLSSVSLKYICRFCMCAQELSNEKKYIYVTGAGHVNKNTKYRFVLAYMHVCTRSWCNFRSTYTGIIYYSRLSSKHMHHLHIAWYTNANSRLPTVKAKSHIKSIKKYFFVYISSFSLCILWINFYFYFHNSNVSNCLSQIIKLASFQEFSTLENNFFTGSTKLVSENSNK